MIRALILSSCLLASHAALNAAEPLKVHTEGVSAKILYEAPINGGHLPELKGKYKMRITEITIAPGGHRWEEHTSELQSLRLIVSHLLVVTDMRAYHCGDV